MKLSNLSWGVATQSSDGTKEFLHVLKAPAGNSLTLPPPADGKVFTNARLLDGGRAVSLTQSNRGITLTLPDGVAWQKPDTVIVMDVLAPGGVGLVNNTSRAVNYLGSSWSYQRNGKAREFRNDSHRATADGDSFTFTFNGTDVEWISGRGRGSRSGRTRHRRRFPRNRGSIQRQREFPDGVREVRPAARHATRSPEPSAAAR